MPELPEVETLKLGLQKYLIGHKIIDVELRDSKLFEGDVKNLIGAKIKDVRRLAKGVLIDLDNDYTVAVHIKLTGQLIFRDSTNKDMLVMKPTPSVVPNKFTRVAFTLSGNPSVRSVLSGLKEKDEKPFLFFQEVRGFAWMKVVKTKNLKQIPFFAKLGPELIPSPGSDTVKLTEKKFEEIVLSSNLPIKVLLMDQTKIGGIGNIYANEGLYDAEIDPRRKAKNLKSRETERLYKSLLKVLELGLKYRGSSELNFVDVLGQVGEYQKHVKAYGKKGKECTRCGGTFQKIYLGGRGTFFCTGCQK